MFAKDKVTQSMIDAVNKVLEQKVEEEKKVEEAQENQNLSEAESLKIPTATGTKVYGHRYGNAAKAHKDQTKHSVDDVKEPTKKDIEKDAKLYKKPDSAQKQYGKERTQSYFAGDYNKNIRKKKPNFEETENHDELAETVRRSDIPAFIRKAKGEKPLTPAEVKAPKSDTRSHSDNLAKARANEETEFLGSLKEGIMDIFKKKEKSTNLFDQPHVKKDIKSYLKKSAKQPQGPNNVKNIMAKEDVELTEEQLDEMLNEVLSKDATAGDWIHDFVHSDNPKFAGKSKAERKKMALGAYYAKQNEEKETHDDKGEEDEDKALIKKMVKKDALKEEDLDEALKGNQHKIDANHNNKIDGQDFRILRAKKKVQETVDSENAVTTDTLAGRVPGGKSNSFKSFKLRVKPLDKEGDGEGKVPPCNMPDENTPAQKSIKVHEGKEDKDNVPFDKPYTTSKGNIKDKSGAVHTPMSRARDLARQAFKKIKNETMMGKAGTTSESKKKW